ncbi:MAG: HI0074 family nucleotidyltransferase substrate-binding subunit [bacterium]|nr:HI0074 family nucleotidyltransferase substrate-binding subunit [bacterium]
MKEEPKYALSKLEDAFIKLKEGVEEAEDELEKDGVIQRFEFTFELLWKALKIFLQDSGIEAKTPKGSLKEAFKIGWLREEKVFLDMLEDRNRTSHIYDKETAKEIFERIEGSYIQAIEKIFGELKKVALEEG